MAELSFVVKPVLDCGCGLVGRAGCVVCVNNVDGDYIHVESRCWISPFFYLVHSALANS